VTEWAPTWAHWSDVPEVEKTRYREHLRDIEQQCEHYPDWAQQSPEQRAGFLVAIAAAGSIEGLTDDQQNQAIAFAKAYTAALGRKWQHSRPRGPR
jgi:hypothetical protein